MPLLFGLIAALAFYFLATEMVSDGHSAILQWALYLGAVASVLLGIWGTIEDVYEIRDSSE